MAKVTALYRWDGKDKASDQLIRIEKLQVQPKHNAECLAAQQIAQHAPRGQAKTIKQLAWQDHTVVDVHAHYWSSKYMALLKVWCKHCWCSERVCEFDFFKSFLSWFGVSASMRGKTTEWWVSMRTTGLQSTWHC